jgi:hypothetical protein
VIVIVALTAFVIVIVVAVAAVVAVISVVAIVAVDAVVAGAIVRGTPYTVSLYMTNEGANGHRKSCNLVTLHLSSRALFVLRINSRVSFLQRRRGFLLLEGT